MLTRPVQLQPLEDRLAATKRLLKSIPGAILFCQLWSGQEIHPQVKAALIPVIANAPTQAREYVEHLLPAEMRLQRLGQNIQPNHVLDLTGDTGRGKQLFIMGAGLCNQCHLAEGVGKSVGPALDTPKSRLASRDQLLEQILKPSAIISDEFRSSRILTIDGQSHLGRITARSDQQLQWLDQQGQLISMAAEDVELVQPSTISLMPENLFSTLSAQQAADLLAYLWNLHSKD
jgi:putative heme-binding domain-containing protein